MPRQRELRSCSRSNFGRSRTAPLEAQLVRTFGNARLHIWLAYVIFCFVSVVVLLLQRLHLFSSISNTIRLTTWALPI